MFNDISRNGDFHHTPSLSTEIKNHVFSLIRGTIVNISNHFNNNNQETLRSLRHLFNYLSNNKLGANDHKIPAWDNLIALYTRPFDSLDGGLENPDENYLKSKKFIALMQDFIKHLSGICLTLLKDADHILLLQLFSDETLRSHIDKEFIKPQPTERKNPGQIIPSSTESSVNAIEPEQPKTQRPEKIRIDEGNAQQLRQNPLIAKKEQDGFFVNPTHMSIKHKDSSQARPLQKNTSHGSLFARFFSSHFTQTLSKPQQQTVEQKVKNPSKNWSILIVGKHTAGSTSIFNYLTDQNCDTEHSTIGVHCAQKIFPESPDVKFLFSETCAIWFEKLSGRRSLLDNQNLCILCIDPYIDKDTKALLDHFACNQSNPQKIPILIVVNKADLESELSYEKKEELHDTVEGYLKKIGAYASIYVSTTANINTDEVRKLIIKICKESKQPRDQRGEHQQPRCGA